MYTAQALRSYNTSYNVHSITAVAKWLLGPDIWNVGT